MELTENNSATTGTIPEYDVYLFDADGTLLNTVELVTRSFLHTFDVFHEDLLEQRQHTKEEIVAFMGIPLRTQMEKFLGIYTDEKYAEVYRVYKTYQESIYQDHLALFTGVSEGLSRLHSAGKKLAIVTSRKLPSIQLYTRTTGIADYFSVIISPEATDKHKPHPAPVYEAIRQLKGEGLRAVFVGDALFDIQAGNAAGVDTIFVEWSHNDAGQLAEKPDYVIKSMNQLLEWQ